MSEPICDPDYWSDRLAKAIAREQAHYAVFEGSKEKWEAGRLRQQALLKQYIRANDSVLDVGCGWGRLLGIMPKGWCGVYLGLDICSEFLTIGRKTWGDPHRVYFEQHDMRNEWHTRPKEFDWAVCCSIKPMIIRNLGQEAWDGIEANLRKVAKRILLLGYDDLDEQEGVI